ncbi:MAG TPA: TetR/AcrR family transcriptional regulator [Terriglobia bacterium]|nr:TetR/AcrR family transcriptional regulator [Terriglobia bacterium]
MPNPESRAPALPSAARAGTLLPAALHRRSRVIIPEGAPRLEQIRSVGCQLLYQHGYAGMTMRQIAAHLQIKAASLYHHYPSKQDILFDIMYTTAMELTQGLLRIEASVQGAPAQLDAAIRWHVLFHTRRQLEAFVSHSELRSLSPENLRSILNVRRGYDAIFMELLNRCQREGIIPRRDTSLTRNFILTMCTATAGWFNPQGKLTAAEVADRAADFVWQGLLSAGGAADDFLPRLRKQRVEHSGWFQDVLEGHPAPPVQRKPDPILEWLRAEIKRRKNAAPPQAPHPKALAP